MKKLISILMVIFLLSTLVIGCAKQEQPETTEVTASQPAPAEETAPATTEPAATGKQADCIYLALEDQFNPETGWKSTVTLTVENGMISKVDWNAANVNAGKDKKTASMDGDYDMKVAGAQADWHVQAESVENFLVEKQDVATINLSDAEGHTDAIAGVSIHVGDFTGLVEKALSKGPVGKGPYKDGSYFAELKDFASSGWKDNVSLTVINGNIVAVNWNGTNKNGGKDKKTASMDGDYGMVKNGGASSEWHEQAAKVEAFLLDHPSVDQITLTSNAHTDAVAGVTIAVGDFVTLCQEALSK